MNFENSNTNTRIHKRTVENFRYGRQTTPANAGEEHEYPEQEQSTSDLVLGCTVTEPFGSRPSAHESVKGWRPVTPLAGVRLRVVMASKHRKTRPISCTFESESERVSESSKLNRKQIRKTLQDSRRVGECFTSREKARERERKTYWRIRGRDFIL